MPALAGFERSVPFCTSEIAVKTDEVKSGSRGLDPHERLGAV